MKTAIETAAAGGAVEAAAAEAARAANDGRVNTAEDELARQLAEDARAEGLTLTGPGRAAGPGHQAGAGGRPGG